MKRIAWILAALVAVGGVAVAPATAQTRVSVSVGFGDPYVSGYVVVGRPRYYYRPYHRPYYYRNHRRPFVVVRPHVVVVPRHPRPYRGRQHRGRH